MKDGGPAFPRPVSVNPNGEIEFAELGMSLRDYFAGQALHAAADAICDDLSDPERDGVAHAARHAKAAYLIADAMLKARSSTHDAA